MSRKKYNIRLQANEEAYDEEMDSLSLREQNQRLSESPRRKSTDEQEQLRRIIGGMIYAVYVTMQLLTDIVHDLAIWVRGEGEYRLHRK